MQQEHNDNQAHDRQFLHQRHVEAADSSFDQITTIINRYDFNTLRQARLELLQFGPHTLNSLQRVFAITHDYDTACNFALTVEIHQATAQLRTQLHICNIPQTNRRAITIDRYRDIIEVAQRLDVTQATDHIFGFGHFDQPATNIIVGSLNGMPDLAQRNVVAQQGIRIDGYLVLLYKPAN